MNTILHALAHQSAEQRVIDRIRFAAEIGTTPEVVVEATRGYGSRPTLHCIATKRIADALIALDQARTACQALPPDDTYELEQAITNIDESLWRMQDAVAQIARWFNPAGSAR